MSTTSNIFSCKPNYPESKARYDAFWNQAILDRPPVSITLPKRNAKQFVQKNHDTWESFWLDIEYRTDMHAHWIHNTDYYADALPVIMPNMGPEIFSACCGCPYHYTNGTTWTDPIIDDWERDAPFAVLDMDHPLFHVLDKFTKMLIERGKGHFIVGLTDIHPGGDHLTALRDPANLAMDLIDNPDAVKAKLKSSQIELYAFYNHFYDQIVDANMPCSSWIPLVPDAGRYYIPSNDFSYMISPAMFEEFFLQGIAEECRFYNRSIYHLDGSGSLNHLDMLLELSELDAVQWVPGSGNEGFSRWVHVYKKIQNAGKSMSVDCKISDLDLVFETLKPEGIWFSGIAGIDNRETADRVLQRIAKWK